jgi:hypothetical protein
MLANMLASSLLRTWFTGDIVVFRNSEMPLFPIERRGVTEIKLTTSDYRGLADAQEAWRYKFRARHYLDTRGYDKVMFVDCDCLALRNIDHLLEGEWDVGYQPESQQMPLSLPQFSCFMTDEELASHPVLPGINSGTLAVKAENYHEVMAEWERIDLGPTARPRHCSDQGSWNRLVFDTGLKKHAFERGEIKFPMHVQPHFTDWNEAALIHNLGASLKDKLRFTFGAYMQAFL